jgi:hypothetical protein
MNRLPTNASLRPFRKAGRAAALAVAAACVATLGPATSARADSADYGCPFGAVCIYPTWDPAASDPEYVFWSYGPHNLSNLYGHHAILNNQSGDAAAFACYGYNGTNCEGGGFLANTWSAPDFTPYNSIVLTPHP